MGRPLTSSTDQTVTTLPGKLLMSKCIGAKRDSGTPPRYTLRELSCSRSRKKSTAWQTRPS